MKISEVVTLTSDMPEKHLRRGQVGTVVEILTSDTAEVEFADLDGIPYAMCAVSENNLMALHHLPNIGSSY